MLVLRHGISEPPVPGVTVDPATYRAEYEARMKKLGRPFWPDAMWRDVVFCVAHDRRHRGLAAIVGPPELGKPPDPAIIDAYPQPDWYLLWYYAVFALMPPKIENYVIIGGPHRRGHHSLRRAPSSRTAASAARGGVPGRSPPSSSPS